MRCVLLFAVLLLNLPVSGQQHFMVKKNLQADWLVSDSTSYAPFQAESSATTIYINLDARLFKTDYVLLKSDQPVSLLINNVLAADRIHEGKFSIDSLIRANSSDKLFMAIHGVETLNTNNVTTQIASAVLYQAGKPDQSYLKVKTSFRDYAITAILVLVIFLVTIIRINPGLSSDYFSIRKIFSLRESEDDHYYYRITSAAILFYVFTSLLLGLYMMVAARFTDLNLGLDQLQLVSYGMLIVTWINVSLCVMLFLFAKIVIIYLISSLFGIREIAGYHFFNFVRLLLVVIGIFTLVLVFYFIPHGQRIGFYNFLYGAIPWILGIWIVLGFFKLASRVRHSVFHLFSYICATELIPFFIIIEVLNK